MKSQPLPARVEMIKKSTRCFALGAFSLLPLIGIPLAVLALARSRTVRRLQGSEWNPAGGYRMWGAVFARIGLFISVTMILAFAAAVYLAPP